MDDTLLTKTTAFCILFTIEIGYKIRQDLVSTIYSQINIHRKLVFSCFLTKKERHFSKKIF